MRKGTLGTVQRQEEWLGWLFVAPMALGILIFQVYPTLFSLYISMTQWNLARAPRWIGFKNYTDLFTVDRYFIKSMTNTGAYAIGVVVPGIALGIVFAMLLNQKIAGRFVYRAIYFVPVVAPTVALGMLWAWIYEPNFGILNTVLKVVGIQGPAWLGSTQWAMRAMIIFALWQGLGYNIVIFLAGLQSISAEYYEAASIDGANAVERFFHITLPLLSPVTFFMLVTGVIGAFQEFATPYILTRGGPANSTLMAVMYLYTKAFREQHMGLASAIAYVLFVVILFLTFVNFRLGKKWVFYEEAV
ncbi:MAG: sugar ABC transporter permease [Chloroflexi bacterium]|nr:sugar ABC transporter permease [Chloroflexota bacterium]